MGVFIAGPGRGAQPRPLASLSPTGFTCGSKLLEEWTKLTSLPNEESGDQSTARAPSITHETYNRLGTAERELVRIGTADERTHRNRGSASFGSHTASKIDC